MKRKRNLISALPTRKEKNITKEEAKFCNLLEQPASLQNIPLDFYDNWVCIVAPNGIRCSVFTKSMISFLIPSISFIFLYSISSFQCYFTFFSMSSYS